MPDRLGRFRAVMVAWLAVWPTITLLLTVVEPMVQSWPLALKTLLVSAVMVPTMVLVLIPAIDRTVAFLTRFATTAGSRDS